MPLLWYILKPEDKLKLATLYRVLADFEFVPPGTEAPAVKCEAKLEAIEEIDKLIRKPSKLPKGAYFRG